MFEKVVESVLEEYVSEWVEGLDSEKMKVALFAGKVEFRDLRMRGAALDKFQLPMKMKSGSVGKLSIKVPWKKLTSQAVKIKIEDVFLVVEPTDQDEAGKNEEDDDSYLLRTRWAKQQEVRMLELLEKVKNDGNSSSASEHEGDPGAGDPDPTASWSYRKKILNTIMDNVSFEFTNIHIRYEDSKHLASSIPLALGLTIDSIMISTTNANGQEEFVDRAQARTAFVHRRLEMVQASVYGDHIESSGVKVGMGPMTSGSNIIHPFSTRINLARNHDERSAATIPKLRCSAEISAIRACLTPEQSTFLIGIADFVSAHEMYLKRLHFQRKRPTVPVRSNARLWWQYALRGVMELHPSAATLKIITTSRGSGSPPQKKEPQALLSMIDTIAPNGQVATRKNPFVEMNIESSENKFQLDCKFERFRYIHNLYATSKLRAYFIPRTEEVAAPAFVKKEAPSPPKLTRTPAALPAQLLRKKSLENAFGAPESTKQRRSSSVRARAVPTREILFSIKLPEIDVFVHTTDASAEVEARLIGTHFQNGAAHNTFELSIEGAETYFLEPQTSASSDDEQKESDSDAGDRKRSTLMQSTSLVFYGQKMVEGYLVPKWQMKCTSPPIQFSMSSEQYQQLLLASAEWQGPSQQIETTKAGKAALFVAEDERLNVGISIPQILIDFNGEGPIQEALSAASTESEDITGFELDIRDLNVMARFSSVAQAAAVDMSAVSLVKCVKQKLPDNEAGAASLDAAAEESEVVNSSIPHHCQPLQTQYLQRMTRVLEFAFASCLSCVEKLVS
ncbi:Lysosomal beta glucosidase [Phytophthora nicotianae]|uniref:Lysosomal beta glucosidase n=1 Tax=Phytophthora nicotianae TaxID=4792 RepID=A0A0W8DI90_PHYNI|nr:Lysosomal beta glucosidase [Phytophthora nicotianae]